MPTARTISINLLGEEAANLTPQGRIISWALTYGRYIMIGTEIVVLLAFISRFSLDRKLTDLKEEISQKQAILEANKNTEQDIRNTQNHLGLIKTVAHNQKASREALSMLSRLFPPGVFLEELEVTSSRMTASVIADTTNSFAQFLAVLRDTKQFSHVTIDSIKKDQQQGIVFTFTATLSEKK